MTKNKINSLITIVVIAIIGIGLFISCKDDNSFSEGKNISSKSNSINNQNPFEIVGITHNEILNDFPNNVSIDNYTVNDIYGYNLNKGYINNSISYDTFYSQIINGGQFMLNYILSEEDLMYNLTKDQEVSYYMGKVKAIFVEMINENKEMTPEEFSERINLIEDELIALDLHDKGDIFDKELNKYSMLLSSLSTARHSYSFWYDAYYNKENPWHNLLLSRVNNVGAKGPFWDFLCDAADALLAVGKAVVAVVGFVPADIGGGLYSGFTGFTGNGTSGNPYGPTFSIPGMITGGWNTSCGVARWGFGY